MTDGFQPVTASYFPALAAMTGRGYFGNSAALQLSIQNKFVQYLMCTQLGIDRARTPLARRVAHRCVGLGAHHRRPRGLQRAEGQHDDLTRLSCARSRERGDRGPPASWHRSDAADRPAGRMVAPARNARSPASLVPYRTASLALSNQVSALAGAQFGETVFRPRRRIAKLASGCRELRRQRPVPWPERRQSGHFRPQIGKSPFDRECVVVSRGLDVSNKSHVSGSITYKLGS
jgi:hypothetical protein